MRIIFKYLFISLVASFLIFNSVFAVDGEVASSTATSTTSIELLQLTVEALKLQLDALIKQIAQLTQA